MNAADKDIVIRDAQEDDMAAVQAIYARHVDIGLGSFEETPPDVGEMTARLNKLKDEGNPFRVAELNGAVRGYAYAGFYRPRRAYRYMCENSVYIDEDYTGKGIGSALLDDLIEKCTALGFRQMVAVIGDSGNAGSINLHARFGFDHIGTLPSVGFKRGRWVDVVLMQRPLGDGDTTLP